MDTSDDPQALVTAARKNPLKGPSVVNIFKAIFSKPDDDAPAPEPEPERTKTAEPVGQVSEQARRNRRRKASSITQGFPAPTLGSPGFLG